MNPDQAAVAIREVSEYLKSSKNPDKTRVASELRRIRDNLFGHQAARVDKFTRHEYETAMSGLEALVKKLEKAVKTMNPQDSSRKELEGWVAALDGLKMDIAMAYKSIRKINV